MCVSPRVSKLTSNQERLASFSASKERESEPLFDFAAALALAFYTRASPQRSLITKDSDSYTKHTQVEGMALGKDMKSSSPSLPLLTLLEPVPDGFNTF